MKKSYVFLWAMSISLVHVLFLWNFWLEGMQTIGINLTIFWLLILGFYISLEKKKLNKKTALWIIPMMLIAASFSFYATEFTSLISLFILPFIFFIFSTHESHTHLRQVLWSKYFVLGFLSGVIHYIASIFKSTKEAVPIVKNIDKKVGDKKQIMKQIIIGILILFVLVSVVIPFLVNRTTVT